MPASAQVETIAFLKTLVADGHDPASVEVMQTHLSIILLAGQRALKLKKGVRLPYVDFSTPGQRGALLLIFYLLVDRKRNPIILDQPEENLDNETIVSLLVPVLNAAKENRQIIMVTHNPNLAVVCDAEQIIFPEFDRKSMCCISYLSGAVESPELNRAVVNVLEGTKPAFNNRGQKYH